MPTPLVLKNATDSYVAEKDPKKNYSNVDRMYVADNNVSTNTRHGYIYFGLPSGLARATILSAKLRIYSGGGWNGSSTIKVYRLDGSWTASKVTWDNKPSTTGTEDTVTKSTPASGTMWEFDVTSMIQQVANGAAWYGFRIGSTNNQGWIHSAQADDRYRPQLVIEYTTEPYPPSVLIPSGGQATGLAKPTLQWDFTDVSGDTTMASYNLRLFSTLALANANASGDVLDVTTASTQPQVDLDSTAYGGLSDGATLWWRVRVQDGAGLWSGWSAVASFTRQNKGTLTLTNPPVGPPAEVFDATPTITWTFTGKTQRAYEVIISKPDTPSTWLWTSGVVTSGNLYVTPPPGIVNTPGATYRLTLRVYDTINRRAVPDDPIYQEVVRDFTLSLSVATPPVTAFAVAPDAFRAWATISWTDVAPAPDTFLIMRDGVVIAEVYPPDVTIGGDNYRYVDRGARPRIAHTWSVIAKKDAIMSSANPTAVTTVKLVTTHISDTSGGHEVFLFNPEVAAARTESSEVHYILGQAPPVLITQAIRGYEGTITGVIAQDVVAGLSSETQLANLEYFKDNPGTIVNLAWVNKSLKVVIFNVTDSPIPYPNGTVDSLVSFNFFEVGF